MDTHRPPEPFPPATLDARLPDAIALAAEELGIRKAHYDAPTLGWCGLLVHLPAADIMTGSVSFRASPLTDEHVAEDFCGRGQRAPDLENERDRPVENGVADEG